MSSQEEVMEFDNLQELESDTLSDEIHIQTQKLISLQNQVQEQITRLERLKSKQVASGSSEEPEDYFDESGDDAMNLGEFPPTQITISTNVHQIGGNGARKKVDLSLCTSMTSKKAMMSVLNQSFDPQSTASQLLSHLQTYFLRVPTTDSSIFDTHKWASETQHSLFLSMFDKLCKEAIDSLQKDPILLHLNSPTYILGDIHGSYTDLEFFSKALWHFGVSFTPSKYLFLGDFVERGPHSIEVIAYLLALKIENPGQVFLVRGNHEFRELNGKTLKGRPTKNGLLDQCNNAWRHLTDPQEQSSKGQELFQKINDVFDWLPLACVLDEKVFCCHGGVPRLISKRPDILEAIAEIERPVVRGWPFKNEEISERVQDKLFLIADLVWADPCPDETSCDNNGFADNKARGPGMKMFNSNALCKFLNATKTTHLIRAHQEQDKGIKITKNTRCITLFSSSRHQNSKKKSTQAAVLYFDGVKVRVTVTDV